MMTNKFDELMNIVHKMSPPKIEPIDYVMYINSWYENEHVLS